MTADRFHDEVNRPPRTRLYIELRPPKDDWMRAVSLLLDFAQSQEIFPV